MYAVYSRTTAGAATGVALTAVSEESAIQQRKPSTPQSETHERSICSHLLPRLLAHFTSGVSLDPIRSVAGQAGKFRNKKQKTKKTNERKRKMKKNTRLSRIFFKSKEIP